MCRCGLTGVEDLVVLNDMGAGDLSLHFLADICIVANEDANDIDCGGADLDARHGIIGFAGDAFLTGGDDAYIGGGGD